MTPNPKSYKQLIKLKRSNKQPIRYSKSNRTNLLVCDMCYALTLIYFDLMQQATPTTMQIIKEINDTIKLLQYEIYGGNDLVLKPRDVNKYHTTLKELQSAVDTVMGFDPNLRLAFISGIIAVCDDHTTTLSKHSNNTNFINIWKTLTEQLQKLYLNYDPDISFETENNLGTKMATVIQNIIKYS